MDFSIDPSDDSRTMIVQRLAGLPFDKKWDILRPAIKHLYVDQDQKLVDVAETIRTEYGFKAE